MAPARAGRKSMLDTGFGEAANGHALLLEEAGKWQPALALRGGDGDEAAGSKDAQGDVSVRRELAHVSLQLTQLFESTTGEQLRGHAGLTSGAVTKNFEFRGRAVEIGDHSTVTVPGF